MALPVPVVQRSPWGFLSLVLNLCPGLGTMVAGARAASMPHLGLGALQLGLLLMAAALLKPLPGLMPWVALLTIAWSLVWGAMILVRST